MQTILNRTNGPQKEFEQAIKKGRLSENPADKNYAGNYMYMGTHNNKANFKNINSRAYDV